MGLSTGAKVGPYEITAKIGAGGMGEVYRAHDSRLNRDVAIKTLPPSFAGDSNRMARFHREAQALAALNHPNIASIFGLEESGSSSSLVMELVEGQTLSERIASGPIPPEEALALARQIGAALEAAHEKGIIHRDLKPANIKLTLDGKVKVLDFGLAKAFDNDPASGGDIGNSPTLTLDSTRAGVILGTAGYMSPEQARGRAVDKRADIWAFGVVLFEMLTGRTAFEGETVSDTLAAVLRADLDWNQLPASTPAKVQRLIKRCLERDPKKRLRDIGDAWIEIDAPESPVATATAARSGYRWVPWAVAAAISLAWAGWALLHQSRQEASPVIRWTYSGKQFFGYPAFSRDGKKMALTEQLSGRWRLAVREMDQVDPKPLPGSDGLVTPDFSPDAQWLVAFSLAGDGKLKKIPVTGGTAITLADAPLPYGVSWGDDGTIVFSSGKALLRVAGSGGAPQTLISPDSKKGENSFRTPVFLPGSRAVIFTVGSGGANKIAALDLKKGSYSVVVNDGQSGRYVPTGHLIYIRGGTLFAAPFDRGRLAVTGPEAPVIEGVSLSGYNNALAEYSVSDGGLLAYVQGSTQGGGTVLGWLDSQGKMQPLSDVQLWGTGRLSPNGSRIANAIVAGSNGAGETDIWIFDVERRTRQRITFGGANDHPVWTPDGKRVVFGTTASGKTGIYVAPADGSARPELLLATENGPTPSSLTPDGRTLLYSQSTGGKPSRILAVAIAGSVGNPVPLHETDAPEGDAQVSPDGKWVAYISSESGQQEAYVQPFPGPGGKERISTEGANSVRWSHDGKQLFYRVVTAQRAILAVDIQTTPKFHAGLPREVARGPFGTTWDVAPDGKRLLVEETPDLGDAGRVLVGVDNWFTELNARVPVKR